jgi:uncharacterized protein
MSIEPRDLKFDLSDAIASQWSPWHAEFSHMANGFMALLPYLEPWFIHNIRTAAEQVSDPQLKADAEGFIKQEARHAQQHRAWNQVLARRYPGFEALEEALKQKLAASKDRDSLAARLAWTAGFEAITYQVVCFIIGERDTWLQGADPNLIAMLTWHAAEEVEHKSVAFDVYQAVHGSYWLRVWGLGSALVQTVRDLRAFAQHMLRVDGLWQDPKCRRRYWKVRLALAKAVVPPLWQYLMPWYQPRAHVDPPVIEAWLAQYREGRDLRALNLEALDALAIYEPAAAAVSSAR